jgi:transposase IS4-like protein
MGFTIRQIDATCTFSRSLTIDALSQVIPAEAISQVIQQEGVGATRERRLTMAVIVWLVIALHLYPTLGIGAVLGKLARGLRFLWPDPQIRLPTDSAIAYRRQQLGARPIVGLFQQVCQPIATPQTRGAVLFGLRAVAIDGASEHVPDTPAHAAVFGRHTSARGASAFPQVQGVYLVECGTHAVIDAGFWPCHTSERVGGFRMLRSLTPGMLVLWDRGFHDFDMIVGARRHGASAGVTFS